MDLKNILQIIKQDLQKLELDNYMKQNQKSKH